ncbi:MAG: type III-B CRISPR module-associated protein Cmr5 [Candidatus Desantisbacteria bacterium]
MQTMQQQRAKYALEKVTAAKDDSNINNKEYKSYASGLPAMIQMNGLGQAAAFYCSKGTGDKPEQKTYRALYNLLSGWLNEPGQPYAGHDLLEGITHGEMHTYKLAQAESLALLDWVKKFARAYMGD